ncbi:hypothetical protein MSHOH_0377 [Methanosarcina horonobensis HB-1 = JCM 15518]|uniref:S-adenosyl-l-methionine hydroxide adenosyltransferase N-terminal domain-containing protein n=1 Tax=Methanosarcina horonobensis HB-1 = JCM 15518 TaxID=1434110 RepID=A0A0E3WSK8_9EURY|nr:hypothetical protein MSHOH_0377 [Methanosarcina horonobensis HB-1 = JCM 15518]
MTHSIRQAGIREGAFVLYSLVPYFPAKSVHVGVFVSPDNGFMIPAARRLENMEVYEITNKEIMLNSGISATCGPEVP